MFSEHSLPSPISGLWRLATNLRWTWHRPTQELFRDLNPHIWNEANQNPLHQLSTLSVDYLTELAVDTAFVARVNTQAAELNDYLTKPTWFNEIYPDSDLRVAYFSPEFAIAEALPQYGGGLGVLAGDHLKTASDLGIPLVGVGLFYHFGYFTQKIRFGRQEEYFDSVDAQSLGLELCQPTVTVEANGQCITVQIWRVKVGRVSLYLLDTAHNSNEPSLQNITDRLYGGEVHNRSEREHRLLQEIVLGIGGIKALRALGETANVYHSNEGHAGFLGLERIRELVLDRNITFAEAVESARKSTVFTTHTPVPAGIDRFSPHLVRPYFADLAQDCGVEIGEILALGQGRNEGPHADFNMAYLGLKLAKFANGVSMLHGAKSREMFADQYGLAPRDVPIGSVTNGVHPPTWTPEPIQEVFRDAIGPDWYMAGQDQWDRVENISDSKLWELRCAGRAKTVQFVRRHMAEQLQAVDSPDTEWCASIFDPDILTIGFARRQTPYKRPTLMVSDEARLIRLLLNAKRPVQIVIAGKAHPHDVAGHQMIERLATLALDPSVRHRIVFLSNYNVGVARSILEGVDVWLNTPVRPHEASGTSGEKSVYNGGLQLSISDGWWDEMSQHGVNGWIIDEGADDFETASNLYGLIENQLLPAFYERDAQGIPQEWTKLMRGSLRTLGSEVSSHRMLRDYVSSLYLPTLEGANISVR